MLPKNEAAVIAAANAARGGQVTTYLNAMTDAIASGLPVFFTGDFNEPSHLDWTAATARPFDLEVEYPASRRIVDAGMTDSFRTVRPDEVGDPAYTWTPGYPYPTLDSDEVHDRIDVIYHRGAGVRPTSAMTVGPPDRDSSTNISVAGYNADHRAVVATYQLLTIGDLDGNGLIQVQDWVALRTHQFADLSAMSPNEA